MLIPDNIVKEIYDKSDIIEVVQSYGILLKKRGRRWWALSPFNTEKTPSFSVDPSQQSGIFYDYSAQKGGNAVSFVMHMENIGYPQALRVIAEMYKIKIPDDGSYKSPVELDVVGYFADIWHRELLSDGDALGYLIDRRGISMESILKFGIGISRRQSSSVADRVFSPEEKVSAGVLSESERGGYYDPFINRICIPMRDERGKPRGFTARIFEDGDIRKSKYINTRETPIFKKGDMILGITENRKHMRDTIYLVEGGFDVIGLDSAGILQAAGSNGTALTSVQLNKVARACEVPSIWRDSGAAGMKATVSDLDKFLSFGMIPKILTCPDGHDPDSIRMLPGFEMENADLYGVDTYEDFVGFYSSLYNMRWAGGLEAKKRIFTRMCESLSKLPTDIDKNLWIGEAVKRFPDASERDIVKEVDSHTYKGRSVGVSTHIATPMQKIRMSDEYHILLALVKHGDTNMDEYDMSVKEFFTIMKREVWDKMYDQLARSLPSVKWSMPGFLNPDMNIILQAIIKPHIESIHSVLYQGMPGTIWASMLHEEAPPFDHDAFFMAFKKKSHDIMNRWLTECDTSKDIEGATTIKRYIIDSKMNL